MSTERAPRHPPQPATSATQRIHMRVIDVADASEFAGEEESGWASGRYLEEEPLGACGTGA